MNTVTIASKVAGEALWAALVSAGKERDTATGSRWVPQTYYADNDAYPISLRSHRFPQDVLDIAAGVAGITVS